MHTRPSINIHDSRVKCIYCLNAHPQILLQAEDRVYRIGQRFPVLIRYLVAQTTVDDFIWFDFSMIIN